jgi:hypothetical protein
MIETSAAFKPRKRSGRAASVCEAFRIDPSSFGNSLRPKQEFALPLRECASS